MVFYIADPDLRQDPAFRRRSLSKWSLQELLTKHGTRFLSKFAIVMFAKLWFRNNYSRLVTYYTTAKGFWGFKGWRFEAWHLVFKSVSFFCISQFNFLHFFLNFLLRSFFFYFLLRSHPEGSRTCEEVIVERRHLLSFPSDTIFSSIFFSCLSLRL